MSQNKITYTTNSFDDWYNNFYHGKYDYENNPGFKKENMTDADFALGQQLFNIYQNKEKINAEFDENKKNLLDNYGSANNTLDEKKRSSEQNAYITYEQLKKYLPQQLKAQGLGGLGVSESALLQAYNTYNNSMGEISAQYSNDKTDLERAKNEQIAELQTNRDNLLYNAERDANGNLLVDNVFEKYKKLETEEKEREIRDNKDKYVIEADNLEAMFQNMIGTDGKISSDDKGKLESYVEGLKESLGDYYTDALNSQLNGYNLYVRTEDEKTNYEQQINAETPTKRDDITIGDITSANSGYGDNFTITFTDSDNKPHKFKVEKGHTASDEVNKKLTEACGGVPAKGTAMIYKGRLYMYLENNNDNKDCWCVVQGRQLDGRDFEKLFSDKLSMNPYSRGYKDTEAGR